MSRLTLHIAVNTISQLAGRLLSSGTTLITSILLARALGASGYGDFSKVTTYVAFFYLAVDFGINAAYLQTKKEDSRLTFGHLLGLRIVLGLLNVFIALAILAFLPGTGSQGYTPLVRLEIILYSLTILFQSLIVTANAEFQERLSYPFATISIAIGSVVTLVLLLLGGGRSVVSAITIFTVGSFVLASCQLSFVKRLGTSITPLFSLSSFIPLLKSALPLSLTLILNIVYFRVDSIILTVSRPTIDVGLYNLAYKFFEFPLTLPVFFLNSLYPLFLENKEKDFPKFLGYVKKSAFVLFLASIPTLIIVYVGAAYIPLITSDFEPSIPILRILSLSIPFFFLSNLTMWILITLKKHTALIGIYGGSMILVTVLNGLFTPSYGPIAAAWITVLGEGVVLGISSLFVFRFLQGSFDETPKKLKIV
jgi:O-antigen/teichoic acid export membrane protein